MKNAIKFALWLSENMYEDMYQDIEENGKTWVSYADNDDHSYSDYNTAKRYTIEELYNKYKNE
jgi:hypothetical protein